MSVLTSTIDIARQPRDVYAFATDPAHFTAWQSDVVAVRSLGSGRFTTTRRFGGARRAVAQQVVQDQPPHHWAAHGVDGPIRPHASISIEAIASGEASRVTFTLDFEGHGIGTALLPVVRRQAAKLAPVSYRRLKQLLESGGSDRHAGSMKAGR